MHVSLHRKKLEILQRITRHDINNQLSVIFGYLSFLEDGQILPCRPGRSCNGYGSCHVMIQRINRFTRDYQDLGIIAPVWQNLGDLMRAPGGRLTRRGWTSPS